jgi:hypothetical protein
MNTTAQKKVGCGGNCSGSRAVALYNTSTQEYTQQHSVVVEKLCNGVTVINKGNTIAMWNGLPLLPDESMAVGGNEGEVFIGRVDISFSLPTPAPPVPVNSAWVIQKFYVDKTFVG